MTSQVQYVEAADYVLPLVLAIVIHVAAALLFFGNFGLSSSPKRVEFEIPKSIKASVVQIEREQPPAPVVQQPRQQPTPQPRPQPAPKPKPQSTPTPVERPKPAVTPAPKPAQAKPVEPTVPTTLQQPAKPAEPVTKPPELAEPVVQPQISEADLLESFLAELEAEDRAIEQQLAAIEAGNQRSAQIASAVANYTTLITQQIQQRWSRPAELRLMDLSNIQAVVAVQLLPTGELDSATIIEASGLATYDQSVLRAIERVRRFEVPSDSDMFEAGGFRRLTITFRPEDLM